MSDDVAEIGAELITAGAAEGILRMVVGAVVRVVRGVVRVVFDS
ncbi:hypothetical protein [Streptomyces finlayi]|nr:hypothetical protein [Streptomyces finlayi]